MINHTHKFIFIHIPKTGGTSIESFLGRADDYENKHDSLGTILEKFPYASNYFKFSVVRNPYDLTVSMYNYMWKSEYDWPKHWRKTSKLANLSFKQWVHHRNFKTPTIHSIHINEDGGVQGTQLSFFDNIKLDFICKFENLQEDFNAVCDKIKIPKQKLPHKNKTKRKHYTEYYDEETKSIVAEKYAKDIEYFGYEFGE